MGDEPLRPLVLRRPLRMGLGTRARMGPGLGLVALRRRLRGLGAAPAGIRLAARSRVRAGRPRLRPADPSCVSTSSSPIDISSTATSIDARLPPTRNTVFVNVTRNVTNYGVVGDRAVNRGLAVEQLERAFGPSRPPRTRGGRTGSSLRSPAGVQRDVVRVFRPPAREIEEADRARPRPQAVARVKPRPAEPPADPKQKVRRERPPTAAPAAANRSPNPGRESVAQANAERRAEKESERQRRAGP